MIWFRYVLKLAAWYGLSLASSLLPQAPEFALTLLFNLSQVAPLFLSPSSLFFSLAQSSQMRMVYILSPSVSFYLPSSPQFTLRCVSSLGPQSLRLGCPSWAGPHSPLSGVPSLVWAPQSTQPPSRRCTLSPWAPHSTQRRFFRCQPKSNLRLR